MWAGEARCDLIISHLRKDFDGYGINMPAWSLAPLYLQQDAKGWLAHGKAKSPRKSKVYEVILTSIHPRYWPDLWKLKLTTMDEVGIGREIAKTLFEKGIEIITAESSVHSLNRYNSMSYLLSLAEYRDEIDGDVQRRLKTSRTPNLDLMLQARLCDTLVFDPTGKPRFELLPMTLYWQLADERRYGFYHSPRDSVRMKAEGRIDLPDSVKENIEKHCGAGGSYSGAVDTENRVIRVLFFPKGDDGVAHIQFAARRMSGDVFERIMQIMSDRQANVIRFQLRRGLNKTTETRFGRLKKPLASKLADNFGRLDVTFESTDPKLTTTKLMNHIIMATRSDELLSENGVDITKPPA